ncbi:magnesium-translocating P-type ATPase [Bordetella genomosp. 11]|uniref:Magnesium-transporting ATPase, P-type 1 n=1 Tax=Bordetella genomosp. 11 TaxID=1416808 RepID=A0A261UF83_9BORD|nr:magnesium-translocating P-type ATPase [Bordetella genomosp. 11]OZI60599.1 magnesium-translocating P-type ATPase [Bordetella genomosp. 11]
MAWESASEDELWNGPVARALASLETDADGLAAAQAEKRLAEHGANRLLERPRRRLVLEFLKRLRNPLVLTLLACAAAAALTREQASFTIIVVIVLLSVLLDFVQEHRALMAADRLRDRVALRVTAMRDKAPKDIPAADLVPGDVILLEAGDLVPADARLIASRDLYVNEALLTGEPYPAEKRSDDAADGQHAERLARADAVFMGCSVISGTARALVLATGRATQLGAIADEMRREPPPTAFAAGIRDFGMLVIRLTVLLVLFVLLVNLLFHRPLVESFLFALALAVGLTPELLPMIVSVTLARGAIRMAREQVIVKRMSAIHDLGSMDVFCSDKTGTLTQARIELAGEFDIRGEDCRDVLRWAYLNASFETGLKSPLDDALLAAAPADLTQWRKIDEVPFDFERRRVSILAEQDGRRYLIVKGAPEDLLMLSSGYRIAGSDGSHAFDEQARATAADTLKRLGEQGYRVLGVGWREVNPDRDHAGIADETALTFAGFAAFVDPPKETARPALDALSRLGISLKIITGDNEWVTRHVCVALGIRIQGVLNGPDLEKLTDEALSARLARTTLFCRVNPAQKARIIRVLRNRGHVVGYLGDGINDAPSLHAADVGLSVDGAADVAKEAAAMILLKQDLNVLAEGVREGRRTFANIMKYVMMGTSSNFGNMFSMAGAVLILPFLPMLPVQVLLNNLLYDTSEIAIPLDRVDEKMIARPYRWDIRQVRDFMLVLGPVSSMFDFLTFGLLLWGFRASQGLFQTAWFVESLMTQVLVIFVIRTRARPWSSPAHPALAATALGVVALAVALPYTALGAWFGFVPLPVPLLLALAGITAAYLAVAEQAKHWYFSRRRGRRPRRQRAASHMG